MGINLGPFARIVGHNFNNVARSSVVKIAETQIDDLIVETTAISSDGRKFYCHVIVDYDGNPSSGVSYLQEYTLSTPMMIGSMALTKNVKLGGRPYIDPGLFFIPPLGNTAFQFRQFNQRVSLFPLTSPYDLTTLPSTGQYTEEFSLPIDMLHVAASPDGLEFFSCFKNHGIYRLSLRDPWDFSYLARDQWNYTHYPFNIIAFKPDGRTMYGLESKLGGEVVMHQYALAPWDIDTLSLVGSYSIYKGESPLPTGLFVSENGKYAYAIISENNWFAPTNLRFITKIIQLQIS
ncbi:MAG: hypothetical protein H7829_03350 [Magnetococcus sp. THC-1_WYH]